MVLSLVSLVFNGFGDIPGVRCLWINSDMSNFLVDAHSLSQILGTMLVHPECCTNALQSLRGCELRDSATDLVLLRVIADLTAAAERPVPDKIVQTLRQQGLLENISGVKHVAQLDCAATNSVE